MPRGSTSRASEAALEKLHNLVTKDLTARIQDEHSTADIRAAIEWLKVNSITGVAAPNSPLAELTEILGGLDFEDVASQVNG
jgi:hypothetical protein